MDSKSCEVSGNTVYSRSGPPVGQINGNKVIGTGGRNVGTIVDDRLAYRSTDSACIGSPLPRQALYLVRETKSTKSFLNLRTSEADKVRCGQKHFETLGVPISVVVSADEV